MKLSTYEAIAMVTDAKVIFNILPITYDNYSEQRESVSNLIGTLQENDPIVAYLTGNKDSIDQDCTEEQITTRENMLKGKERLQDLKVTLTTQQKQFSEMDTSENTGETFLAAKKELQDKIEEGAKEYHSIMQFQSEIEVPVVISDEAKEELTMIFNTMKDIRVTTQEDPLIMAYPLIKEFLNA